MCDSVDTLLHSAEHNAYLKNFKEAANQLRKSAESSYNLNDLLYRIFKQELLCIVHALVNNLIQCNPKLIFDKSMCLKLAIEYSDLKFILNVVKYLKITKHDISLNNYFDVIYKSICSQKIDVFIFIFNLLKYKPTRAEKVKFLKSCLFHYSQPEYIRMVCRKLKIKRKHIDKLNRLRIVNNCIENKCSISTIDYIINFLKIKRRHICHKENYALLLSYSDIVRYENVEIVEFLIKKFKITENNCRINWKKLLYIAIDQCDQTFVEYIYNNYPYQNYFSSSTTHLASAFTSNKFDFIEYLESKNIVSISACKNAIIFALFECIKVKNKKGIKYIQSKYNISPREDLTVYCDIPFHDALYYNTDLYLDDEVVC